MLLRFKTLLPGSLLIEKKHNIFKKLWYKLKKKELPYNKVTLILKPIEIMDTFSKGSTTMLAEPKRRFNDKETVNLFAATETVFDIKLDDDCYTITGDIKDIIASINKTKYLIKGNTVSDLLNSKNYYAKLIIEEKNWNFCIY